MNMLNVIKECLEQKGFYYMGTEADAVTLYVKEQENRRYLVVISDFIGGYLITEEQYLAYLSKLKQSFHRDGKEQICLSLLCTDKVESVKYLAQADRNQWIVDIVNAKVIIYENQVEDFLHLQYDIEHCLGADHSLRSRIEKYFSKGTLCIILLNIIVFIIVELTGSSLDSRHMLNCGAMYWPKIAQGGQYYRLITSMFLHFGISHLANNMLVLGFMGNYLEKETGTVRYLLIYFLSGIIADLVSIGYNVFRRDYVVSAGASGAVFGIVGAIIYIIAVNRGKLKDLTSKQIIIFIILSMYAGFTSPNTDNAAHIGGVISGFILAALIYRKPSVNKNKGN